ncbi:MAG: hypothetical protein IIB40_02700 [Candidatus Marinimicrobia bacterium]|nr:hypothetical protein [Candidatus Neomarinimicrobiota bacterium]
MKFKARFAFVGLLITAFVFAGCNIFSWSATPEESEDLLEDGLEFMLDGNFEAAESLFALGLLEDSLNSDLLYNHAKATLLSSGESIITILNELQKFDQPSGTNPGANISLPFFGREKPEQDNLYVTNITIFNDLNPIFDSTIVTTGSIEKDDITLDLFIANTVKGILRIADTNGDERIDDKDFDLSMFSTGSGGFEFDSSFVDSLGAEDLNALISSVTDIIDNAGDIFEELLGDTDIDTTIIDNLMDDITGSLEWYYVNTLVPGNEGEGDNDGDGVVDDECINQIDDDGDGLIDEDAIVTGGTPGWDWSGAGTPQPCP